jgi:hypothetical protein
MRNQYKILAEVYKMVSEEPEVSTTQQHDKAFIDLVNEYLGQPAGSLTGNITDVLEHALEQEHDDMVQRNLTQNDNSVDAEFDREEVIDVLATRLGRFAHKKGMNGKWVQEQVYKHLQAPVHEIKKEKPVMKKTEPSKTPNLDKNPFINKLKDKKGSFGDLGSRLG